tara:strand:- start:27 stop:317 length:291 start_codon:yes stop_codon:yes gene_type:complete
MGQILVNDQVVNAEILLDSDNCPLIQFNDPAYIRAETVLFNAEDRSVHAVLYEGQFLIGHVPEELNGSFEKHKTITLSADHFTGKKISLKANLIQQ